MSTKKIAEAFLKNRAELLPDDIWERYIVPPLFNRLPIFLEPKSLRIQGGRGCGKTMFLRYLCHPTRFSTKRECVPLSEFSHVGLFWRPDTQFCALMRKSWLGDMEAELAFIHYATLVILDELARSFDSIANAKIHGGSCDLRQLQLPAAVRVFLSDQVTTIESLKLFSAMERAKLELWVQNPDSKRPIMLRFERLLEQIAAAVIEADDRLEGLFFRVFVDEFENLQDYQRKLVCDYVKHPNKRFNVCFAMRQHAITQFPTSGGEQILNNHDVFTIDIEYELEKNDDFKLLAAEFLLERIRRSGYTIDCPEFDFKKLVDESALSDRVSTKYRSSILSKARQIFPGYSAKEIAYLAIEDGSLNNRLIEMINKGLRLHKKTRLNANEFVSKDYPEVSVITGALVNRDKPGPDVILKEIQLLKENGESKFFKTLIENNLHGCLFYLYIGLPRRPNLLYSGFDRFCSLSSPNIRFFQQLCQVSFALTQDQLDKTSSTDNDIVVVPIDIQASAAEQVSEMSLLEVERLGLLGLKLLDVVTRLGKLFAAAQRRPSQSEVEINHFSIEDKDKDGLTEETNELIRQAKIWSIFYEEKYTKNKSDYDLAQTDIIPNPIFSPYFRISYRKKKKITLTSNQMNVLMTGSGEQFEKILTDYSERWRANDNETYLNSSQELF